MNKELFDNGMTVRREVVGDHYVDQVMAKADDFNMPFQELVTEFCWGAIWTRPGLDRRSRSLLNIGMLAALGRSEDLGGHIRGAITNGMTKTEIQECLLQVAVYVGMPAGNAAFGVASKVFAELKS